MKKTILIIILFFNSLTQGQFWENPNQKPSLFGMRINRGHLLGDPIGLWLMSEGFASKVFDLSGNGHVATLMNNAAWSPCKFGPGLILGAGNYAWGTLNYNSYRQPRTVHVWIYLTTIGIINTVFSIGDDVTDGSPTTILQVNASNRLAAWGTKDGVAGDYLESNETLAANTWYAVTFVSDPSGTGTYRFWINAVECTYLAGTTGAYLDRNDTVDNFYIGSGYPATLFEGFIDHMLMYRRVFSDSKIALLYREPFCMFEPNWDLNLYFGMSFAPPGAGQFIYINMN